MNFKNFWPQLFIYIVIYVIQIDIDLRLTWTFVNKDCIQVCMARNTFGLQGLFYFLRNIGKHGLQVSMDLGMDTWTLVQHGLRYACRVIDLQVTYVIQIDMDLRLTWTFVNMDYIYVCMVRNKFGDQGLF